MSDKSTDITEEMFVKADPSLQALYLFRMHKDTQEKMALHPTNCQAQFETFGRDIKRLQKRKTVDSIISAGIGITTAVAIVWAYLKNFLKIGGGS